MKSSLTGVLIVGHGTRSPLGQAQFLWLVKQLQAGLAPLPVEPAFLELAAPTIDDAVGRLVGRGIEHLVTVPLLLFAAGHAKEDIPSEVRAALTKHDKAELRSVQAAHFGCHPALLELSRLRLHEVQGATEEEHSLQQSTTCHLLVGRGSRDETATAEMVEYARICQQSTQLSTEIAFLAMAQPTVSEQLAACASRGFERVVVQPHLLFHGDLIDRLQRQVAAARINHQHIDWLIADTLADAPSVLGSASKLLQVVVRDRCQACGL